MKINKTTLNYLSGIFDGEGCICLSKSHENNRPRYRVELSISMNDRISLEVFQKYFGGNINIGNGKRHNRIAHDCYVLKYSTQKTKEILTKLLPYLLIKKEQAKIALEFINVRESFNKYRKINAFAPVPHKIETKYEKLYNKCRSLKKHNWMQKV